MFIRKYKKEVFCKAAKIKCPDEYGKMNLFNILRTKIDDDKIQSIINTMNEQDIIIKPIKVRAKLAYNDDWITLFYEIVEIIHNQSSIIKEERYDIEISEDK